MGQVMAVRLVESTTQNAPPPIVCDLKKAVVHAYILVFMFLLMLLPSVAIFEGVVITDSAPVCVFWIRGLDET